MAVGSTLTLCLLTVGLLLREAAVSEAVCTQSPSSQCLFDCGDTILDLTPLVGKDNKPVFQYRKDRFGKVEFTYSPCTSFTEGLGCRNTSVCLISKLNDMSNTDIGSTRSVVLTAGDNKSPAHFTYTHRQGKVNRETQVKLVCDKRKIVLTKGHLHFAGEIPPASGHYDMTLFSKYACFQAKAGQSTPSVTAEPHSHHSAHGNTTEHSTHPTAHNVTHEHTHPTTHHTTHGHTTENTTHHTTHGHTTENTTHHTTHGHTTENSTHPPTHHTTEPPTHPTTHHGNHTHPSHPGEHTTEPASHSTSGNMTTVPHTPPSTTHNGAGPLNSRSLTLTTAIMTAVAALLTKPKW